MNYLLQCFPSAMTCPFSNEVLDDDSKIVSGFINPIKPDYTIRYDIAEKNEKGYFAARDIYQLFRDRNHSYSGEFQSIVGANEFLSEAVLVWRDNWVTFIDGMLQLNALRQPHHGVSQPTRIRSMYIDVSEHSQLILKSHTSDNRVLMQAKVFEEYDNTRCGGVLIETIRFRNLLPFIDYKMNLKTLTFVPNFHSRLEVLTSLEVYLQIVSQNVNKNSITVVGIPSRIKEGSIFMKINDVRNTVFGIRINYEQITQEMALENYNFKNVDLVLVQNLSTDKNICQRLQQFLQRDQFVMSEEDLVRVWQAQPSSLYRVISIHSIVPGYTSDRSEVHLVRWGKSKEPTAITTIPVRNSTDFNFLNSVRANLSEDRHLLVITPCLSPPGLKELIRSWRKEAVRNKVHLITINSDDVHKLEEKFHDIELAFNVVNNGNWGGEFYLPVQESKKVSRKVTLQSQQLGNYESLKWMEAPKITGPGVTVTVHYVGISSNDIKKANGSLNFKHHIENSYGSDFSGITESGERVMGIVRSGAASTQVRAQPELLWPVPAHWSLEDAATVPLAYAQAFYCLGIKASLFHGRSVLVHGGAGALGQAVISIALAHDCEVFTTVSDINKKHFLLKLFPELKADHIGSSRDHTFRDMIMSITKKKGCDFTISCVKGSLKDITIESTSPFGENMDISQLQNQDNYDFGMFYLNSLINYHTVDFSFLYTIENLDDIKAVNRMLSEGIVRGYVRPLSRITYAPQEVARAFNLVAMSQHRGRILLRMHDDTLQAEHRLKCSADRCHLIFCNRVTFGLQLADRLVARGVKKLCLQVPTQSSYLQHKLRLWEGFGVQCVVSSEHLNVQKVLALINDALALGPLEGVYVTMSDGDGRFKESFISNLDSVIRKSCSDLRYFAVLHVGDHTIGKEVCLRRLRDQLPATMLMLPGLKNELEKNSVSWPGIMNAVEEALQSTYTILLAHTEREGRPSLLQQISKFLGISIPDDVEKTLTLKELGVEDHKFQLICYLLQVEYNIAFSEEQVSFLTIDRISELERTLIECPYEDVKGLSNYFNYVDPDELLATTEMVLLPTFVNSASMRDDEFEPDQKYLYIVPGMEGHYERFRELCKRLKVSALVLQPGLDHPNETLRETAERFAEVLLRKTGIKKTFYLLGYESGVVVALEIAAILEDHELTGTVFCLGYAPDESGKQFEEHLAEFKTEEQLQDGVLQHMYSLMAGGDTTGLVNVLQNVATWSQKVDACVRVLLGRVPHSAQYASAHIKCALGRIEEVRRKRAAMHPLRSQLVLLRAATAHPPPPHKALQQYSQQPLIVYQLRTPLAYVTTDLRCAAIINEHLDPAILEDFTMRNLCNTYLLNANSFMAIA